MTQTAAPTLWRHPDFLRFWASRVVTIVGSSVTSVALPVLVYHLTGSAAQTSAMFAVSTVSMVVFGLGGGVIGDRFDRRRIMVAADLVSAAAIASLVFAHLGDRLTLPHLYAAAFASASAAVVFDGSSVGAMPLLVGRARLPEANARVWGSQALLDVLVPALVGLALAIWSPATLLIVDVLSFLGSALLVRGIRSALSHPRDGAPTTKAGLRTDLVEGMTYLRRHQTLWPLMLVAVFGAGSSAAILGLIVPWADRVLRVGTSGWRFGLIFGGFSAGAFVASLIMPRVSRRFGAIRMTQVLLPVAALLVLVLSRIESYWPALAVYVMASTVHILQFSAIVTYRMQIIPEHLLSRVGTMSRVVSWGGGATLGVLIAGQVATRWGVPAAITGAGVTLTIASALAWVPALRRAAPTARYAESE
ncbi:MFS transporter [Knoellia sp. S7-12]|uniref:MFS transporter n=1 Tax=Knoellia sp. S7-12 TaxID=3126698 RepID=UPI0033694ADF